MFKIIQSNDTLVLLEHLADVYKSQHGFDGRSSLGSWVFDEFTVIVPSMVLGDWLNKAMASRLGISTLFTTQFWGQYQWQIIQKVLQIDAQQNPNDALKVPEVAVLSGSVMRWRLFGFLASIGPERLSWLMEQDDHPLRFLLAPLCQEETQDRVNRGGQSYRLSEQRVWQVCQELSSVYVRYLTHRPEWLHAWTHDLPLPKNVAQMIAEKDALSSRYTAEAAATPDWLIDQYTDLEKLLRYLWQTLFAPVYAYRESLEQRFWQVLEGGRGALTSQLALSALPSCLYLFTVQQIPQVELEFLKRLSVHLDVCLLHFNQSKMFWADIVDKNWLATQRIINPASVYLKDFGHALLSRLGKESRETFAMLVDMSGGEFYYEKMLDNEVESADQYQSPKFSGNRDWQVVWQDDFCENFVDNGLLNQLKKDILMLEGDTFVQPWLGQNISQILLGKIKPKSHLTLPDLGDDAPMLPSLSIHACHSLKRQLEIARIMIARYLNSPSLDGQPRQLSDVVVYLPDVEAARPLIELIFDEGQGADGLTLPAKITGVTNPRIDQLMSAIAGFYGLLGAKNARFHKDDVYEWLMTPMLYQSFGLGFDDVLRACELLDKAGFVRGFDARHLAQVLDLHDTDYRYSFSYALDRIVAGFLMPSEQERANDLFYPLHWQQNVIAEASLPLSGISLADQKIVQMLCALHEGLSVNRDYYLQIHSVQHWLDSIERDVIDKYFAAVRETPEMHAIFEAKNSIAASLRANHFYRRQGQDPLFDGDIRLSLQFVLESISQQVAGQAVSAEASGAITFARFGALRSVPFGMTIMLDMNLTTFPRQDKHARLDLMQAGLRRRGDRLAEDDDNGAFLDALLCSQDACLIFYTAFDLKEGKTLLPATCVSELLSFFKSGVDWQAAAGNQDALAEQGLISQKIAQIFPSLIERYLVIEHTPNDFDRLAFYEDELQDPSDEEDPLKHKLMTYIDHYQNQQRRYLPPAPIWQHIRQILDKQDQAVAQDQPPATPAIEPPSWSQVANCLGDHVNKQGQDGLLNLLDRLNVKPPNSLHLTRLISAYQNPARLFLRGKKKVAGQFQESALNEPRMLNALDHYQINSLLIPLLTHKDTLDGLDDSLDKTLRQLLDLALHDNQDDKGHCEQLIDGQFLGSLYYGSILPAGVCRFDHLRDQIQELADHLREFYDGLMDYESRATDAGLGRLIDRQKLLVSPTQEQALILDVGNQTLSLLANLPSQDSLVWLSALPTSASAKHVLGFWLYHLCWQLARATSDQEVKQAQAQHLSAGCSIWHFKKKADKYDFQNLGIADQKTLVLMPVQAERAKRLLEAFVYLFLLMPKMLLALTPKNTMLYLGLGQFEGDLADLKKPFQHWLEVAYHYQEAPDDCSLHAGWLAALDGADAWHSFCQTAGVIDVLYDDFRCNIKPL